MDAHIDMREHQEAFEMVETVHQRFEGFTQKRVEDVITQDEQVMLAYPVTRSSNRC